MPVAQKDRSHELKLLLKIHSLQESDSFSLSGVDKSIYGFSSNKGRAGQRRGEPTEANGMGFINGGKTANTGQYDFSLLK